MYIHPSIHAIHAIMAEARAFVAREETSNLASENPANTVVFPLKREEYCGKKKIKWLSDFEALKLFAFDHLKLVGEWCFTTNNGGFHVLKSESVTLSFYPNTKTLNVQGMLQSEVRKNILSFISQPTTNKMRIDQASGNNQDGAEATKESEEGESNSEEDDSIEMQADNTETVQNTQSTLPNNANHCCCSKNMAAIFELSNKFAVLEAKFKQRQK